MIYAGEGSVRFKCAACGGALDESPTEMRCPSCGRSWPVRDGIPRFFEPDYYWGEVTQEEAGQFLKEVREKGWRAAVGHRFAANENMRIGLTDWQRASWLPMLGLPGGATALDIGSGYGAITQALSRGVERLYSLEAIPERIEFTRLRLEQEGVRNVRLVQGTGLQLPFMDASFDLIVVNGVLEWVGEWRTDVSPRDAQLGFLRDIHRLLRPGGLLLVGIENRFGLQYLSGGRDHSGLPYTSLIPHWLATVCLKLVSTTYRGRASVPRREYRTYTYSKRGYRALIAEGGFASADFFWSDPGYNQPYGVIPLRGSLVAEHFEQQLREPTQSWKRGWKHRLKALAAKTPIVDSIVADFLIVSEKQGGAAVGSWRGRAWERLRAELPQLPAIREPILALSTRAFSRKSIIRVFDGDTAAPRLMLKASTVAPGSVEELDAGYRALETVARRQGGGASGFAVPQPIGRFTRGGVVFTAESAAPGRPLSHFVFSASAGRRRTVAREGLERSLDAALAIAASLRGAPDIPAASAAWRELPDDLRGQDPVVRLATIARDEWQREPGGPPWSHHGDFSIENVFSATGRDVLAVIDWEHLVSGTPALYDVYSLLVSALPAIGIGEEFAGSHSEAWAERFKAGFFGAGPWADTFRQLLGRACAGLGVPESKAWPQFVQFLLLRTHYYADRGGRARSDHMAFLAGAAGLSGRFLLPG
ncbi:MAG: methyltransferase domain-containing protein [Gemmatimonadetes bacterium]|nr:methyltransferase domain-containing protein [Gemmatimonadota bacterium]